MATLAKERVEFASLPRRSVAMRVVPSVALFLTLAPAGCEPEGAVRKPDRETHIVMIGEGKDEPSWPVICSGAAWFSVRFRKVTVETVAPETSSPRFQLEMLRDCSTRKVTVVCIFPTDPDAVRAAILDSVRSGTPVLTFGRDVEDSGRVSFSGPSEVELGVAAAAACRATMSDPIKTVILLSSKAERYARRARAFRKALQRTPRANLMREVVCEPSPRDAVRVVRAESRMYPRVGAWVFLDDWPLRGIDEVATLVPRRCRIVVCQGSPKYFDHLRNGDLYALVGYDLQEVVREVLFAAVQAASGENNSAPPFTAKPEIITRRNVDDHAARWAQWQTPARD